MPAKRKFEIKAAKKEVALCEHCGQPMLPPGIKKLPNEYDHAQGCPARKAPRAE